jgi:glycosyltransferase involved in cell wall biosynthesis/MoaA/NifB/PqqE/SkfB family radical SAM enzyme
MRYNAGSEVYSQTLCHGLSRKGHEIHVFTREEDPFARDYQMRHEVDQEQPNIQLHIINMPRTRDRYRHTGCDQNFAELLEQLEPDIVHIGHLNHLSTSLPLEAAIRGIPIIYTLHDYWVMCPRGQFMQMHPEDPENLWATCDDQEDRKCAEHCYARYFSGAEAEKEEDITFWTHWIKRRMVHIREMTELIDTFIAPSRYLYHRYHNDFHLPEHKLRYLDYGFDLERLNGRTRISGEPFTFGYIGTHIPAKGIHDLIRAFGQLRGSPQLRIWGRYSSQNTDALKAIATHFPNDVNNRIFWMNEYENQQIIGDVFNLVDAIVVPSVWVENSPLVIHEAQQARVPVITADVGGMAEYVHREINGLQFQHRNYISLAEQMQRFVDLPELACKLGTRGYIYSASGDIPTIEHQVATMESIYAEALMRRNTSSITPYSGPWRITFDTNPDDCNFNCIMCEEHSPYSKLLELRASARRPRRRMDINLIRKVVQECRGTGLREIIPSTMGEPLLYPHFDQIISICKEEGIMLNLTTNGSFPRRNAQAWAELIIPVTSDVKFSLNGATKETQEKIMLGSRWDKLINDLKMFIKVRDELAVAHNHRCRITFQVTFIETNVEELPDIVRLAANLGIDRVKGHHIWTHFIETESLSMRRNKEAIARWNQVVAKVYAAAKEHPLPNGKTVLLDNIFTLNETSVENLIPGGPCPFLGKEAWINTEGRFDPCCAPDAERRTLGQFGNISQQNIREIWEGENYQRLIQTYRTRSLCLRCNMRRPVEVEK